MGPAYTLTDLTRRICLSVPQSQPSDSLSHRAERQATETGCVCVCVRERERERGLHGTTGPHFRQLSSTMLPSCSRNSASCLPPSLLSPTFRLGLSRSRRCFALCLRSHLPAFFFFSSYLFTITIRFYVFVVSGNTWEEPRALVVV